MTSSLYTALIRVTDPCETGIGLRKVFIDTDDSQLVQRLKQAESDRDAAREEAADYQQGLKNKIFQHMELLDVHRAKLDELAEREGECSEHNHRLGELSTRNELLAGKMESVKNMYLRLLDEHSTLQKELHALRLQVVNQDPLEQVRLCAPLLCLSLIILFENVQLRSLKPVAKPKAVPSKPQPFYSMSTGYKVCNMPIEAWIRGTARAASEMASVGYV